MTPVDVDKLLAQAGWDQWREDRLGNRELLAGAARQWCASSHWREHTPRLEQWKTVVSDLRWQRLTEAMLIEMTGGREHSLPFPAIPLFEGEQVRDLCGIVRDVEAAAALAEQLKKNHQLLTVEPADAARKCWENLAADIKGDIDFHAWQLLFSEALPDALPSFTAIQELRRVKTPRRQAAVRKLENLPAGTLALPETEEKVGSGFAASSAVTVSSGHDARLSRLDRMVRELFEGIAEPADWAWLEHEISDRGAGALSIHPVVEMTRHLRENDYPVTLDDLAWKSLQKMLDQFHHLLDIDAANPNAPLPALELACSVRSTLSPGLVALGIIPFAAGNRQRRAWWRAVREGLRPAVRRAGWMCANDRWETAIQSLKWCASYLDETEKYAMNQGLLEGSENFHGR